MDKLSGELQRRYDSFCNLGPKDVGFYLGASEYMDLVLNTQYLLTALRQNHDEFEEVEQTQESAAEVKQGEPVLMSSLLKKEKVLDPEADWLEIETAKNRKMFSIYREFQDMCWIQQCVNDLKTGEAKHAGNRERFVWSRDIERIRDGVIISNNCFIRFHESYREAAKKLHSFLLKATADNYLLSKPIIEMFPDKQLEFDERASTLYVKGRPVKIKKQSKLTMAHRVLKYIFVDNRTDVNQEFFFTEYAEKEFEDEAYNSRKYTSACEVINRKILEQVGFKAFLIVRNGRKASVKINPKYRLESQEGASE